MFVRYCKALIGQDTRIIGLGCHDVSKPKVMNVYTKTLGSSRMHKKNISLKGMVGDHPKDGGSPSMALHVVLIL